MADPVRFYQDPKVLVPVFLATLGALYLLDQPTSHTPQYKPGASKRPVSKEAKKLAKRAESRGDTSLADQLESGEIRGNQLRELIASGQLRIKRNPNGLLGDWLAGLIGGARRPNPQPVPVPRNMTAADRRALNAAKRLALEFHGAADRQVIELSESERHLPRFVTVLGEIPMLEYEPTDGSKRAGYTWDHKAGDRGLGVPGSPERPVLAAASNTRRPLIVPLRSPVRFTGDRGLIG